MDFPPDRWFRSWQRHLRDSREGRCSSVKVTSGARGAEGIHGKNKEPVRKEDIPGEICRAAQVVRCAIGPMFNQAMSISGGTAPGVLNRIVMARVAERVVVPDDAVGERRGRRVVEDSSALVPIVALERAVNEAGVGR